MVEHRKAERDFGRQFANLICIDLPDNCETIAYWSVFFYLREEDVLHIFCIRIKDLEYKDISKQFEIASYIAS